MAKIFRFSGYFVDGDKPAFSVDDFEDNLKNFIEEISSNYAWQQLHIEESESFELDGEDKENCDLALLTRHFKKNSTDAQFDRPLPVAGKKYRHFKIGKIVTVIGVSMHTETEEITVVYEHEGQIWNRPIEMFMSEVDREKYPDATQKYRFELVESACEKLGEYEDAEEKRLLLLPPVHTEQEVYRVNSGAKEPIIPMVVTEICYHSVVVDQPPVFTFTATDKDRSGQTICFEHEIGKKVFLTREEAEQALKKMESEE